MWIDPDFAKAWGIVDEPDLGPIDFSNTRSRELYIKPTDYQNILDILKRSDRLLGRSVFCIFGGPGVGKTTLMQGIASELDNIIYCPVFRTIEVPPDNVLSISGFYEYISYLWEIITHLGLLRPKQRAEFQNLSFKIINEFHAAPLTAVDNILSAMRAWLYESFIDYKPSGQPIRLKLQSQENI